MKVVSAMFLALLLGFSFGCDLSQPPATRPASPLPRSDNMEVTPGDADSPFRLLEGYQVCPAAKQDQTA